MTKKAGLIAGLLVLFLVSCVTVNLYFPAAEMKKAADKMVDDEFKGAPAAPQQPKSQDGSSVPDLMRHFSFGPSAAHAAEVDVNVSTPAIRALKESLRARFQTLRPYFDKGVLGHNIAGYIEIREAAGLSLKEKAELNTLVGAQNKDRKNLYEEIVQANKLGSDAVPRVEKIFSDSRRAKSRPGWWIQQDNGQWVKK
jgi:uncharacterized protein YdbL (DUF1318 family)